MSDCATLWTVAPQVPLSMGILQARILEWVVMPSSRGSYWLRHLPALAAGFFTTSATPQPIPVFAGAQGNQTATLSSFSHRLYCLNIFHYDFFWTDFNFTKTYIPCRWVTSLSIWYHIFIKRYFPQSQTAWLLQDSYRILPPTQNLFFFFFWYEI